MFGKVFPGSLIGGSIFLSVEGCWVVFSILLCRFSRLMVLLKSCFSSFPKSRSSYPYEMCFRKVITLKSFFSEVMFSVVML